MKGPNSRSTSTVVDGLELVFDKGVPHVVPHAAFPGAHRAGPSSDTSEDGWECDGWHRELGDSEVAESYMDAKFGGEGADIPGQRPALRK